MRKSLTSLASLAVAAVVALMSATPVVLHAQATPAAAAPAATPAATPSPTPTLDTRVADLEAYVTNSSPNTTQVGPLGATPGPGHNAWMMVSAAFVLMMTLPGLALFYGGLVRSKNVLSIVAMCFGITGLVTILWWAVGYSLVFGTSFSDKPFGPFLGGTEFFFFKGVTSIPNTNYSYWVSQNVFAIFQLTFAIITPALIFGSTAERMKFSAVMTFVFLWMFVVYFPLAHMVWGASGFMNGVWNAGAKIPAIDFAGGTVVHMSSGWTALILCLILGKRLGFGKEPMPPHSMVICFIGTALLWVGWYGFNAGSAVAADVVAANAFTTTTLATAVASFVWPLVEWVFKGKPSILGFCSGAVAGLVVITPACGFVNPMGSVIIGVAAGTIPFLTVTYLKPMLGYDDALDTFGVHAIGGTLGALLTGILVAPEVNANLSAAGVAGKNGLLAAITAHKLWIPQLEAIGITILLAVVGTAIIGFIVKLIIGLRPTPEAESQGLDVTDHGEEGYILS
ncbi:MAG TPA: ammonium transporter [Chthoniobacterales bacterium]|jgi:Amt family ammonium transporter